MAKVLFSVKIKWGIYDEKEKHLSVDLGKTTIQRENKFSYPDYRYILILFSQKTRLHIFILQESVSWFKDV